jgi:hypothetical protein
LSDAYILVQVPPRFFLPVSSSERVEGQSLSIRLEDVDSGTDDAIVSVLFWDKVLTEGNGFSVTRSGASWTILIPAVYRNDTGVVRVVLGNTHGSATANFTLNVIYPPEFTGVASVRSVQLRNGSTFTFNCTPSDANPSSVTYSFRRNGTILSVSGSVLTISSVVRGDSGNYSCTATNSAGSTTVYYGLLVVAPPTEPQTVTVSQVTPFSSTISWTPPTDDGGISSPSWTPPSPHSSTGLTYHVTYSNSSGSWTSTVNSTQSVLAYLQHSTDYTVSVVAENVYGRSTPSGEVMFRTNDSKPIIDHISLMALSLTNFTVNITFLTVGGQTVTSFKIMVNGLEKTDTTQVTDGKLKTVSLVVDGLSLTKGTDYSVSVTATNSIGESEPVMGTLTVPNPPSITSPPTELPPNSTSPCCSGVKLNLARPQDVSDVRVSLSVNGGPYEMVRSGDLTLTGDILYISGLQAGTDYTVTVDISNIFGSTMRQITLKPLLGQPSNPADPTVTVDGTSVTVVLRTDYPGTERTRNESMFTFQVHFNKNGRSTRQSVLDTVDVSPLSLNGVSTDYRGVLEPGSYTVSVTAVNEHGNSSSVMSEQFSVQAAAKDNTTIIIGAVVGVVVFILLVLILIFICIICYKKFWRTRGHYKTESGKPVPLTNNGANGDNKEDIEMMENQTALYDEVDRAGAAAKKKKEAMGVVNQYDDPDVQQQPEMYAEVDHSAKTSNKKKKKKEEKQQETAPQPEVYAEVDKSAKTTKKGAEAQDDEPKPPPHTEGLVYAQIDFANKSSTYKKPEPKNDDVVIYSEVTVQHQPRKQDDDKEQDGNNDRDDRAGSPNAII